MFNCKKKFEDQINFLFKLIILIYSDLLENKRCHINSKITTQLSFVNEPFLH